MKLTIEQKIEAYKYAKKKIMDSSNIYPYMCVQLKPVTNRVFQSYHTCEDILRLFPELLKYKPDCVEDKLMGWFSRSEEGRIIRVMIIDDILRNLKTKVKSKLSRHLK